MNAKGAESYLMTTHGGHQSGYGQGDVHHFVGGDYHLSTSHLYNAVDGFHQILVAGADSHDVMTVVGH